MKKTAALLIFLALFCARSASALGETFLSQPAVDMPEKGISFVRAEDGHLFARLAATNSTAMLYRELPLPEGAEAMRLSWKWRVTGLQKGDKPWFDARMMLEILDAGRHKVSTPRAINRGKDSEGWEARETAFLVPEGGRTLKFIRP